MVAVCQFYLNSQNIRRILTPKRQKRFKRQKNSAKHVFYISSLPSLPMPSSFSLPQSTSWSCVKPQCRESKMLTVQIIALPFFSIFTVRAYARVALGVAILSVRLSVTCVDCDKSKWCTADNLVPHERAITVLL